MRRPGTLAGAMLAIAIGAHDYRENPNGVFAPFNPTVTCMHHRGAKSHSGGH